MATNIFSNITQKGTIANFMQAMANTPTIWEEHVQRVSSTAASEQYVWPGFLPVPREFLSGRNFQGIIDFTYTVTNGEFEMSFLIDRKSMEDDQHGMINSRIQEAAEAWATFKDFQFITELLVEGDTLTTTFDGTAFHTDTRTIGGSANIDNASTTVAAADDSVPTSAEFLTVLNTMMSTMSRYQDDQGRPFTATAMNNLRMIVPPEFVRAATEGVNSTLIGGGNSNPWGLNIVEIDSTPYMPAIGTDTAMYLEAVGSNRRPFIYQERTPLEIVVFNGANDVVENNGVKVLTRQRYKFAFGEPRYSIRHDFTT